MSAERQGLLDRSMVFTTQVWEPLPRLARAAERAGLHRVWTTQSPRRDALVRAAGLAAATSSIGVATGVSLAFDRSPMATAGAAIDLSLLSGGRFTLGIGAGTRGVRRQFGVDIDRPAPWFEEYVAVIRAVFDTSRDRIAHAGQHFALDIGAARATASSADFVPPAIYGAAVNAAMTRAVARACDGLALLSVAVAPGFLDEVTLPSWHVGRSQAGWAEPGRLACWCVAVVDADRDAARALARRQLGFYFSTPSYGAPALALGFGSALEQIRAALGTGGAPDWDRVVAAVPEEMVDCFALAGTATEVGAGLGRLEARLAAAGVDEIVLQVPGGSLGPVDYERACLALLDAVAPAGTGVESEFGDQVSGVRTIGARQ